MHDVILGNDLLLKWKGDILYSRETLLVEGERIRIHQKALSNEVNSVHLSKEVLLEPFQEAVVAGQWDGQADAGLVGAAMIVEPNVAAASRHDLLIGRVLCVAEQNGLPVLLANLGPAPISVRAGTKVGRASKVSNLKHVVFSVGLQGEEEPEKWVLRQLLRISRLKPRQDTRYRWVGRYGQDRRNQA